MIDILVQEEINKKVKQKIKKQKIKKQKERKIKSKTKNIKRTKRRKS